jgi:hypothetical protein
MAIRATKSEAGGAFEMPRECREMTSQRGKDAGHTVKSSQHPVSKSAILSGQPCDFVTSPEQTGLRSGLGQNGKSRPVLSSVRPKGDSDRHRAEAEIPGGSACKNALAYTPRQRFLALVILTSWKREECTSGRWESLTRVVRGRR